MIKGLASPRQILMTADTVGGVWTYAIELSRHLARHNTRVALATMGEPPTREQRAEAHRIHGLELYQSAFRLEWMDDPWDDVQRAGDWLLRLEEQVRPDLVHLNGYAHGALPWRAPVLVAAHSCVLSWWEAVKGEQAPASWERYHTEVRRGLQAARFVVAPTRSMLFALERHYGKLPASRVVPNARDGSQMLPGPHKEPFIFTAGRLWDEAKNIAALDRVASRLKWPVFAAGDTRDPDGRQAFHTQLRPLGRLPAPVIDQWLQRASIYALPARYEPFGLSALEAGLSGCALVLGDISSLREVWGDAALFVPPDDPEALSETLNALIEDRDRRDRLAAAARARALEFSPRRMVAGYLEAYGEVTAISRPAGFQRGAGR